ncbi:MAG: Zn-ribbon domain-containing OB-fold protein [Bdellovibrionota bacterium]
MTAEAQTAPASASFWEGCARGELLLLRCEKCGTFHHMAPSRCSKCLSEKLSWAKASGKGRVASFTVVHRPPSKAFEKIPYILALVDLEEGPRLMAHVEAAPKELKIGMSVKVRFVPGPDGRKQPAFEAA